MGYRLALRQVSTMRRLAERSPALFSPTKFPCTAWYVTASLNVKQLSVCGVYPGSIKGYFNCDKPSLLHQGGLFATRDEAIAEAERKLEKMHDAYVRAGQRWTKARETVSKLKGGAA